MNDSIKELKETRLTDKMRTYLKHCWSGSVYEFCMKFNIGSIVLGDKLVQEWFGEEDRGNESR